MPHKSRPTSPTPIFITPNCQPPPQLGRLPGRAVMISSAAIGKLRPNDGEGTMRSVRTLAAAVLLLLPAYHVASAGEPKQGGVLKVYHRDSPGSASIHEG